MEAGLPPPGSAAAASHPEDQKGRLQEPSSEHPSRTVRNRHTVSVSRSATSQNAVNPSPPHANGAQQTTQGLCRVADKQWTTEQGEWPSGDCSLAPGHQRRRTNHQLTPGLAAGSKPMALGSCGRCPTVKKAPVQQLDMEPGGAENELWERKYQERHYSRTCVRHRYATGAMDLADGYGSGSRFLRLRGSLISAARSPGQPPDAEKGRRR